MGSRTIKLDVAINEPSRPELALWRAVVAQALSDACAPTNWGTSKLERDNARGWLLNDSRDFRRVCEFASLDPDAVRESAERLASKGWPARPKQGRALIERETDVPRRRMA